MLDKYEKLKDILLQVRKIVDSPDTDTIWSKYNSTNELINEIDSFINKLNQREESVLKEIKLMFLPTSSLQEVSLSSGWGHEFICLADEVDRTIQIS